MEFNIVDFLQCFKSFFTYPVPLGVDILVVSILFVGFYILQDNRRKDYVTTQQHSSDTNALLQNTIKDKEKTILERQKRIKKLEKRLDFCQKHHKGGK